MRIDLKTFLMCALAAGFGAGCAARKPPAPPPPVVVVPEHPVEGTWQTRHGEKLNLVIFKPGGDLVFQGGLEFYNPGRWNWDPMRKKLLISFPRADEKKLEIFFTLLNDGVQAYNPARKEVSYRFDEQTSSLNIAGWIYTKVSTQKPVIPDEPVLR